MRRKLEFVFLFVGVPVLLRLVPVVSKRTGIDINVPIIPVLVVIAGFVLICSLLFSGIEHALYGNFLFTIGWGEYFFHAGTLRMLSQQ